MAQGLILTPAGRVDGFFARAMREVFNIDPVWVDDQDNRHIAFYGKF